MKKAFPISFFVLGIFSAAISQEPELVVPVGHSNSFGNFYFSPDGSKAATTAFKNKMVAVWDVKTGKLIATFTDTLAFWGFTNIQFSADGSRLITHGGENMLWDIERKEFIGYLSGHSGGETPDEEIENNGYTLTPDGKAVVYSKDSFVYFVIPGTTTIVKRLDNREAIKSFNISSNGDYLLSNSGKETLLWHTGSNVVIKNLAKGNYYFTGNGQQIIELMPGKLRLLDAKTGTEKTELLTGYADTALLSTDAKNMLVLNYKTGNVKLYAAENGSLRYEWKNCLDAWFYPDNKSIIITRYMPGKKAVSDESVNPVQVEMWDNETLQLQSTQKNKVYDLVSQKGDRMAEVTDKLVKIYHVKTGSLLRQWNWHGHIPLYEFITSSSGRRMFTCGDYINVWDSDKGQLIASSRFGYDADGAEEQALFFLSGNEQYFAAVKKDKWQVYYTADGSLVMQSVIKGATISSAAFSNDGRHFCVVTLTAGGSGYATIIGLPAKKVIKKFPLVAKGPLQIAWAPGDSLLAFSDEEQNTTAIRSVKNFQLKKNLPGIFRGESNEETGRLITTTADKSLSYCWNIGNLSLQRKVDGVLHLSTDGKKGVTNTGLIINMADGSEIATLEDIDEMYLWDNETSPGLFIDYPRFSPDGKRITATLVSLGSGGSFPSADVWDAASGHKLYQFDTAANANEYISTSGKKILLVSVDGDEDMRILDTETKNVTLLNQSREGSRTLYGFFTADDKYLFSFGGQVMKKWDVTTGQLLYTFFPVDSTSYITQIPSGYYSCNPDAAKLLHYVKGLQIISFQQLDLRYNRPDKVMEYIRYPDTSLINSYHKAWQKRVVKAGADTSYFLRSYSVPEADFVNRDETDDEQSSEKITLRIRAYDSVALLDRFNVWINEVPLWGRKGISLLSRRIKEFDTTITLSLTTGENSLETSVTNMYGVESFRSPLPVNFRPPASEKISEKVYFIGIGINRYRQPDFNLSWSVKDIRDLAASLKKKYGSRCYIDTLFDEQVSLETVAALKNKLDRTGINDKVIIAYSGHGLLSKDLDYYLSTYDVNFSNPSEKGLPYDELENLLDNIPARKKLMLIDACHSGEVDKEEMLVMNKTADSLGLSKGIIIDQPQLQQHVGLKNSFELMQSLFVNVGKSTGATIISAAAGNQFALERGDLKNGVFTYSILEAMTKYPALKISELKKIVGDRVQELTNGLQKPTSRNENISADWSL